LPSFANPFIRANNTSFLDRLGSRFLRQEGQPSPQLSSDNGVNADVPSLAPPQNAPANENIVTSEQNVE